MNSTPFAISTQPGSDTISMRFSKTFEPDRRPPGVSISGYPLAKSLRRGRTRLFVDPGEAAFGIGA